MASKEHYHTHFEEGGFYHIYNRTVDSKPMFKNEGNYLFFLQKFDKYLSEVLDVYVYCLLDNHFHFLVRIKDGSDLTSFKIKHQLPENISAHEMISKQLRIFFQSYALAFNKQQNRIGTLFQRPFKRVWIDNMDYFTTLIYYIHSNPQKHNLASDFRLWKWSSYHALISSKTTKIKRKEVMDWFGDVHQFIVFHNSGKFLINTTFALED
jgi:REP element-mobilizing transposase RayT